VAVYLYTTILADQEMNLGDACIAPFSAQATMRSTCFFPDFMLTYCDERVMKPISTALPTLAKSVSSLQAAFIQLLMFQLPTPNRLSKPIFGSYSTIFSRLSFHPQSPRVRLSERLW
jgi:hypothetical protein